MFDEEAEESDEDHLNSSPPPSTPAHAAASGSPFTSTSSSFSNLQTSFKTGDKPVPQLSLIGPTSIWKNDDLEDVFSIRIILPSAVNKKNQVKINVSSDLKMLEISIKHPASASDVKKIQDSVNIDKHKFGNSHPKMLGFHNYFRQFRDKDSDPMCSKSIVNLPFVVKKKISHLKRVKDADGCHCVDIDLIANQDDDCLECDDGDEDFEEVYL